MITKKEAVKHIADITVPILSKLINFAYVKDILSALSNSLSWSTK